MLFLMSTPPRLEPVTPYTNYHCSLPSTVFTPDMVPKICLMEKLLDLYASIAPLSVEFFEHMRKTIKPRRIRKHEILLREGQICKEMLYVETGLLRSFYWFNETEVSTWFMSEEKLVISIRSFFWQLPSYEYIEALENGLVWVMTYDELQTLYKLFPEFNLHRSIMLEHYSALSDERHHFKALLTAQERYESLIAGDPALLNRVPDKYLASYLGVHPSSLSRIKGQYERSKRDGGQKAA